MSNNKIMNNETVYYHGTGLIIFGDGWSYTGFKNGKYAEFKTYEEQQFLYKLIEINKKMGPWCYGDQYETETETKTETETETETKTETKTPTFIFDLSISEYVDDEDDEPAYIQPPYDNKYVNKKVINFFTPKLFFKKRGDSYLFNYINDDKKKSIKNSEFVINQIFKHFDISPLAAKNTYIKLIRDFKNKNNTKWINDFHAEDIKFWDGKKKTNKFNPSLVK